MKSTEILTIIGWPASCLLSILAGGFVIPRLTRKRKILSWATISENALIPSDLHETLSVPITIQVGGVSPHSLTLVTLRIGNAGNEVIENIAASISINQNARVLYIKPSEDMGEFQNHFKGEVQSNQTILSFEYLNPRDVFDFELLLMACL
jgi:hypothetical protein